MLFLKDLQGEGENCPERPVNHMLTSEATWRAVEKLIKGIQNQIGASQESSKQQYGSRFITDPSSRRNTK